MKKICDNCNSFHLYEDVTLKSPKGGGCCLNIDANPLYKTATEKSCHPFRMIPSEVKSCATWEEQKNEKANAVQVEARAEGKEEESVLEESREVQESLQDLD